MDDIVEVVDLPDPTTQPLVHPLDIPAARRPFIVSRLLGIVGPAAGLAITALVWRLNGSIVVALVAGFPVTAVCAYFSRINGDEAWGFIPRKRQDRGRPLPTAFDVVEGLLAGGAILLASVLVVNGLATADLAEGVVEFIVGASIAVAVAVGIDVAASIAIHLGSYVGRPAFGLLVLAGVVAGAIYAEMTLVPDTLTQPTQAELYGALSIAIGAIAWWCWLAIRDRVRSRPA